MNTTNFISKSYQIFPIEGIYNQSSPSNIALIKYWGKLQGQIPANASLSFSLTQAKTITSIVISPKKNQTKFDFDFYFHGQKKEDFHSKIETFFDRIVIYLPFLTQFHFEIRSENTFPHSSGIASSASSMSALAGCLMQIEKAFLNDYSADWIDKKTSFLARLGSGSACRSTLSTTVSLWGRHPDVEQSSDLYAVNLPFEIHSIFHQYQDTILLIDKGQKKVSSTQGHQLMQGHQFAQQRFVQAQNHLTEMLMVLQNGDLERFIQVTESEALTLHAMMMCSQPYFILMNPNTLCAIEKIWDFRAQKKLPICFTLDAGANIHLLYPKKYKKEILSFIDSELSMLCQNGHYICDQVR